MAVVDFEEISAHAKCLRLPALTVERNAKFLLNQQTESQCIVEIVTQKERSSKTEVLIL